MDKQWYTITKYNKETLYTGMLRVATGSLFFIKFFISTLPKIDVLKSITYLKNQYELKKNKRTPLGHKWGLHDENNVNILILSINENSVNISQKE